MVIMYNMGTPPSSFPSMYTPPTPAPAPTSAPAVSGTEYIIPLTNFKFSEFRNGYRDSGQTGAGIHNWHPTRPEWTSNEISIGMMRGVEFSTGDPIPFGDDPISLSKHMRTTAWGMFVARKLKAV